MIKGRRLRRRAGMYTALMLLGLTLWPALTAACPPVLQSVTVEPNGNHPTSTWTLPASSVTSQFVQTSRSSDVNEDGYFTTLVNFNPVAPAQTTLVDQFNFEPGTYYLHVAGHDKRCTKGVCQAIEFSDVMSFDVAAAPAAAAASFTPRAATSAALSCSDAGTGGGVTLPPTTGGPGPDKVKPFQTLSFSPIQRVGKLFVRARMSEAGKLTAKATVGVAGASKVYKFKTVSRSVTANNFVKLRLKLVKKQLKAVKRALKRGKKLKAKVTVTATDMAGNKRAQKATIRLKP